MSQQAILNVIKQTADKWQNDKGEKPKREPFFVFEVLTALQKNGISPVDSYDEVQQALGSFFK